MVIHVVLKNMSGCCESPPTNTSPLKLGLLEHIDADNSHFQNQNCLYTKRTHGLHITRTHLLPFCQALMIVAEGAGVYF